MPQIDHVVCPVDLTDASARALGDAFAWARWHDARLHVIHVAPQAVAVAPLVGVGVPLEPPSLEEIARDVERFVAAVPNPGVATDIQTLRGDPPSVIRREAQRYPRAIVVMGSHGRSGFEHFVMGSVADRVAGGSAIPTLVIPPQDTRADRGPLARHIVCAVDLLASSLEGLRYALSMACEAGGTIDVVHVVEEGAAAGAQPTSHFRVPEYLRARAADALAELTERVLAEAREACTVRERVVFGHTADALLQVAGQVGADLIVLGSGDRAHLRSLWLGRTTSQLARAAHCPLLIVPTPAAIKQAIPLDVRPLARQAWRAALASMSQQHLGDPATLTVTMPGFAAREAVSLPLIGVVMDGSPEDTITLMLGGPAGVHLSHAVTHPTEVLIEQRRAGADSRLLVRSADGSSALLEVARPRSSTIGAAAEARLQL